MHKTAVICLVLASLAATCCLAETVETVDVVIVGAGSAGLYAARDLAANGYVVKVLEASDRHGGRVLSTTLGVTRLDMGAEVHYTTANPSHVAIEEAYGRGIYTANLGTDFVLSMEDNAWWCYVSTKCWWKSRDFRTMVRFGARWNSFGDDADYSTTFADQLNEKWGIDKQHQAYHLYHNNIGGLVGGSMDEIGVLSLLKEMAGATVSGNDLITDRDIGWLDALDTTWWRADGVLDLVDLERPVVGIDYGSDRVNVTDAAGDVVMAHKVIVTASLGVLLNESIAFEPALPSTHTNAMQGIGWGRGMKVALRFSAPFWRKSGLLRFALPATTALVAVLLVPGLFLFAKVLERPSLTSRKTVYIAAGVTAAAVALTVVTGISALAYRREMAALTTQLGAYYFPSNWKKGCPDTIAQFVLMGKESEALTALGSDQAIVDAIIADLDATFDGGASKVLIDSYVQDWTASPYIRGSYSFPALNTHPENGDNLREQLGRPVNGRVFIAGEATNPINPSTVPGALAEGERAAGLIHKLLGGVSDPPSM